MREFKIWLLYTNHSFEQMLSNRWAALMLLSGKIMRVALFMIFLSFLFQGAKSLAGYSREQIIFFYLSFNLIDTLAQLFFREVYRFRSLVVSGGLDLILFKPINPLLRVLLGGADLLDLIMLFLLTVVTTAFAIQNLSPSILGATLYALLVLNSLAVAAAFHIFVLGLGITTTSVDHLIMIYRDMTSMLRIPVDLYVQPLRFLLTFVLPLGIMITFPAQAFLGLLSWEGVVISLVFGVVCLFLALKFWDIAVKKYSSASS